MNEDKLKDLLYEYYINLKDLEYYDETGKWRIVTRQPNWKECLSGVYPLRVKG